jgi:hypothetical protein
LAKFTWHPFGSFDCYASTDSQVAWNAASFSNDNFGLKKRGKGRFIPKKTNAFFVKRPSNAKVSRESQEVLLVKTNCFKSEFWILRWGLNRTREPVGFTPDACFGFVTSDPARRWRFGGLEGKDQESSI